MHQNIKNMKNLVIAFILLLVLPAVSSAQFSMGLKAGIISPREQYKDITVGSGAESYVVAVKDMARPVCSRMPSNKHRLAVSRNARRI